MKLLLILILVAAAGALSTGCASKPSIAPGDMPRLARDWPEECKERCGRPPSTAQSPERHQLEMTNWALACARLHDDCADALNQRKE